MIVACIGAFGACLCNLSAQNLTIQPPFRMPDIAKPSGYSVLYKGFTCIKNKKRRYGEDVKIYFLGISENMRPNEMASMPFDSLMYSGIKSGKTYNAPVLTIFEGQNTGGVTLLCHLKEAANARRRLKRNRLITCLDALNGIRFTISRGMMGNIPTQDLGESGQMGATEQNESATGNYKWRTQITANLLVNPMGILSRVVADQKDCLVEKEYLFISANELQACFRKPLLNYNGVEHNLTLFFENGDSVYKVYFEIAPK